MNKNILVDGEWEGFYIHYDLKSRMDCYFKFDNGKISGHGNDTIDKFTWSGNYDNDYKVSMIKTYPSHTVDYNGHADENGIWGKWNIGPFASGGFHLWPKKKEEEKEKLILKKSVINKKKKHKMVTI
jgi:hypothetical protein